MPFDHPPFNSSSPHISPSCSMIFSSLISCFLLHVTLRCEQAAFVFLIQRILLKLVLSGTHPLLEIQIPGESFKDLAVPWTVAQEIPPVGAQLSSFLALTSHQIKPNLVGSHLESSSYFSLGWLQNPIGLEQWYSGRVFALDKADSDLIPGMLYGHLSTSRSDPWV